MNVFIITCQNADDHKALFVFIKGNITNMFLKTKEPHILFRLKIDTTYFLMLLVVFLLFFLMAFCDLKQDRIGGGKHRGINSINGQIIFHHAFSVLLLLQDSFLRRLAPFSNTGT